jgi:AraC-like DNA-binding protein
MMRTADPSSLLQVIAAQILRHAPLDGETTTVVPGLSLLRFGSGTLVGRGLLRPCVCVVAQGEKTAQPGNDSGAVLRYRAGDFLSTSIDMPLVGQIVSASRTRPYLAVVFELTPHEVLSVAGEVQLVPVSTPETRATFVGRCDSRLLDVVLRLLDSLDDEREARFLAPLLRRELVYRLVTGPSAAAVCQSAALARPDEGLGRAIDWIREHFKEPLQIERLARHAKMSTSSLHHKFKATVMMGPLQYQKRLRLEEARRLLLGGLVDATQAALDVGYESTSQFTREYRRQFGLPPLRDVKRMRA